MICSEYKKYKEECKRLTQIYKLTHGYVYIKGYEFTEKLMKNYVGN